MQTKQQNVSDLKQFKGICHHDLQSANTICNTLWLANTVFGEINHWLRLFSQWSHLHVNQWSLISLVAHLMLVVHSVQLFVSIILIEVAICSWLFYIWVKNLISTNVFLVALLLERLAKVNFGLESKFSNHLFSDEDRWEIGSKTCTRIPYKN